MPSECNNIKSVFNFAHGRCILNSLNECYLNIFIQKLSLILAQFNTSKSIEDFFKFIIALKCKIVFQLLDHKYIYEVKIYILRVRVLSLLRSCILKKIQKLLLQNIIFVQQCKNFYYLNLNTLSICVMI